MSGLRGCVSISQEYIWSHAGILSLLLFSAISLLEEPHRTCGHCSHSLYVPTSPEGGHLMVAQCVTVENGTFLLCVHLMTQGISITPNHILLPLKATLCPHIDGSRTSLGVLVIPGIAAYKASFFLQQIAKSL